MNIYKSILFGIVVLLSFSHLSVNAFAQEVTKAYETDNSSEEKKFS